MFFNNIITVAVNLTCITHQPRCLVCILLFTNAKQVKSYRAVTKHLLKFNLQKSNFLDLVI
jgi:hypothetical protein